MKKKILITRKLLRSNEERSTKLWVVVINGCVCAGCIPYGVAVTSIVSF